MQDRYTGDIGDFGKYVLLRALFKDSKLKLGINWYLVDPKELSEHTNKDGGYTQYLRRPKKYKKYDCETFNLLQKLISEERSTKKIEKSAILPKTTVYFRRSLSVYSHNQRETKRNEWLAEALSALKVTDVVFFDPDNGLEIKSCRKQQKRSIKYIYYDEPRAFYDKGKSLIIYQHKDRKPEGEYLDRFRRIKREIPNVYKIYYIRFKPYSVRDYVFILQKKHETEILNRLKYNIAEKWIGLFGEIISI